MKIPTLLKTAAITSAFVLLTAGCASNKAGTGVDFDGSLGDGEYLGADIGDMPLSSTRFDQLPPVAKPANVFPVYFDYNQSVFASSETAKIQTVAQFLKLDEGVVVMVEGNCDERGTNEYNISLGEYRAESVRAALVDAGIAASRIQTVSFGEEKPVDFGHNETAWSANRRADFSFYRLR